MAFKDFNIYISSEREKRKGLKHSFYPLSLKEIEEANILLKIPKELKIFYSIIGYGYMYNTDDSFSIDRLLSPNEFVKINLRQDYYEFDPTLEYFNLPIYQTKLIFFEVVEGNYLLIDKKDINGKNAIYYFDEKIANSLDEFLDKFDKEGHYFEK